MSKSLEEAQNAMEKAAQFRRLNEERGGIPTGKDELRHAEVAAAVASAEALTRIADAMEKAAPADFTKELPF